MINPRCPKCGFHAISRMDWTWGGAIVTYWCPRCSIEVKLPKTTAAYKTKPLHKQAVSNKTEMIE